MTATVLTLTYGAQLASSLFNYQKGFVKNVGLSNAFFHLLQKSPDGYVGKSSIGERAAIPLMYEIGTADSYTGYDILSVAPMDGFTMAFYDWRQAAIPCSISGDEELKNDGEAKLFDLLKGKILQAQMGIEGFFNRGLILGNGGVDLTVPYTSVANGSVFVDPLFHIVRHDPTAGTVGSIPCAGGLNTWWRNQHIDSAAATYNAFRMELRRLYHQVSMAAPKGGPNLHLTQLETYDFYERSLEVFHENPSMDADIPFDNVKFKGKPVVYDELMPNTEDNVAAQDNAETSWAMLNTKFFQVQYHTRRNFSPTNMQNPTNQDAKVSHILWYGAVLCSNRAKQGLLDGINSTVIV